MLLLKSKIIEKRNYKRISLNKSIKKATTNLNNTKSATHGTSPERLKEKNIKIKEFKEVYDFHRLNKVKEDLEKRKISDINSDNKKSNKLREPLHIGEKVLVLAERQKKKDTPGNLYKSITRNKPYFKKGQIFVKRVSYIYYYYY